MIPHDHDHEKGKDRKDIAHVIFVLCCSMFFVSCFVFRARCFDGMVEQGKTGQDRAGQGKA
jgi:hypothetical protein